jgi:hypothetical protein
VFSIKQIVYLVIVLNYNKRINRKTRKYHTVKPIPQFNKKNLINAGETNNPNTHIHDLAFTWLGPEPSLTCGGVKLV